MQTTWQFSVSDANNLLNNRNYFRAKIAYGYVSSTNLITFWLIIEVVRALFGPWFGIKVFPVLLTTCTGLL